LIPTSHIQIRPNILGIGRGLGNEAPLPYPQ